MVLLSAFYFYTLAFPHEEKPPLKIGLVFSTTGFRTLKEKVSLEAALLAIEQINQKGGVLGRPLKAFVRDAESRWETAKNNIEELILQEKVDVIVGCWTKASLYTTKPLFEKHQNLLIYPFQYEGILSSPNILWLGAALNQQVMPSVAYCMRKNWKTFYLVGSNYIIPHTINILARDQLQVFGGEVVGERYLNLEESNEAIYTEIVREISETKPDVVFTSILGNENNLFFNKLKEFGIQRDQVAIFSFTLDEVFLQELDYPEMIGTYAIWNYFRSIDSEANKKFVRDYQRFSEMKAIDNPAEASYFGIFLWAQAVEEAGTADVKTLRYILPSMRIEAPEGPVTMDVEGQRAWKYSRIGQIEAGGQFKIIWESNSLIRPMPFQIHRSQLEWELLTDYLYKEFAEISNEKGK